MGWCKERLDQIDGERCDCDDCWYWEEVFGISWIGEERERKDWERIRKGEIEIKRERERIRIER